MKHRPLALILVVQLLTGAPVPAFVPVQPFSTHQQPSSMTTKLANPTVKAAIEALNAHDRKAWDALVATGATFADDGSEGDLAHFTDNAFGKGRERFTSIDKVENNGLDVYGRYHSDTWGDFKTYFRFHVKDGKVTRLEVGQASY